MRLLLALVTGLLAGAASAGAASADVSLTITNDLIHKSQTFSVPPDAAIHDLTGILKVQNPRPILTGDFFSGTRIAINEDPDAPPYECIFIDAQDHRLQLYSPGSNNTAQFDDPTGAKDLSACQIACTIYP